MGKVDKSTLESFEAELKAGLKGEEARAEFYTLARGVTPEMEAALLSVLERCCPGVAQSIQEELERI